MTVKDSKASTSVGNIGRAVMVLLMVSLLVGFPDKGHSRGPDGSPAATAEEASVYEAARQYLDAEVRRDLKAVYSFLAPSSVYRATYDYDAFLAEAQASPVRIITYTIRRVAHIRDNHDPKAFPKIEKFARVEVDVVVFYQDTKQKTDVNFDFTFIKEAGKWYKG
jgi:hypothetical protein